MTDDKKPWGWLGSFPTTNAVILVGIVLFFVTGVCVLVRWSDAPEGWYYFLGSVMFFNVGQFVAKRVTQRPPPAEPGETGTTTEPTL